MKKQITYLFLILFLSGCGQGSVKTLTLAAYSTPREVYQELSQKFEKEWLQETGEKIRILQSYAGSGAQARAIIGGFEADIAALSLASDLDKIADAGLMHSNWREQPYEGVLTRSVVAIATRQKNVSIESWQDLLDLNPKILMPNPQASGAALWNILGIYGAGLKNGQVEARQLLKEILSRVQVFDKGSRESITNFERGIGDALIVSESEILIGIQAGGDYKLHIPQETIKIENPAALIDVFVDKHGVRKEAEAFLNFLRKKESQAIFARHGFRPIYDLEDPSTQAGFISYPSFFTIKDLGGWTDVLSSFFGPNGIYAEIFQEMATKKR